MSKSFKFKNNTYLDTRGIVHNKNLVSTILDTKTIYDSGNNTNGSWIRYNDGTMICTKKVTGTSQLTNSWGSLFESRTAVALGNYAIAFVSNPVISATLNSDNGCWLQLIAGGSKATIGNTYLTSPVSKTVNYVIDIIAIGKWK